MSASDIPAVVAALTALVVAIAQLITALNTHGVVKAQSVKVDKIDVATNGALDQQKALVDALQSSKATPAEIAARSQLSELDLARQRAGL